MTKVPENLLVTMAGQPGYMTATLNRINFLLDEVRERREQQNEFNLRLSTDVPQAYERGVAAERLRWGGIDNETSIASIAFEKGVEAERKRIREAVGKLPVMFPTDLLEEIHKAIDGDK